MTIHQFSWKIMIQ